MEREAEYRSTCFVDPRRRFLHDLAPESAHSVRNDLHYRPIEFLPDAPRAFRRRAESVTLELPNASRFAVLFALASVRPPTVCYKNMTSMLQVLSLIGISGSH